MAQTLKDLFIQDDQIERRHISPGAVGPEQIESGTVGSDQIQSGSVSPDKLSSSLKDLLLPNSSIFFALANSFVPSANNPFVTRDEIFSFTAHWKDPVQKFEELPVSGNTDNDIRLVAEERIFYVWQNNTWLPTTSFTSESQNVQDNQSSSGSLDFILADFELGSGDSFDIDHAPDAEFNRIVQVKEKVLGNEFIQNSISFEDENSYIKDSLYTITDVVVAIAAKQVLPGNRNIVWNPGIIGLIAEDLSGFNYRIESIIVQNGNNLPQLINLETNIKSNYTGTVHISNATVTDNSAALVRQRNPKDFTIFSGTSRLSKTIERVKVLGSEVSGITAVITQDQNGLLEFNYTINGCDPIWKKYNIAYLNQTFVNINELFAVNAETFHAVHIITSRNIPDAPIDTDLMTQDGNINGNDMYAVVYTERGTKKPYLIIWCHNFGSPVFGARIALDSNASFQTFNYEDIHMDIKEFQTVSDDYISGNLIDEAKRFDKNYVIAITGSILESDGSTDRIALWLNDNVGHDLRDGWNSSINPVKTNQGYSAEAPKVIISPGNFSSEIIEEDGNNESRTYRLWVIYRDRSISGIKSVSVTTPSGLSGTVDNFNFKAGQVGLYPGDNNAGSVNNIIGINSASELLFFESGSTFTCIDKNDFDAVLWEGESLPGLYYQDSSNNLMHRRGTPVVISSNASNEFEIWVQYKTTDFAQSEFSIIQKTNKFGRNLKLNIERVFNRHFDHQPFATGNSNSDNLHIFYINSDLDDRISVPFHIHNRNGTWIDEDPDTEINKVFTHRIRHFSDHIEYLDFTNINHYDFAFDDRNGIEFAAFVPADNEADRGVYYTSQKSKCKYAIWGAELGELSPGPGPRAGFTYFHYNSSIYIQGGYGADGFVDPSMWRLNVQSNIWEVVVTDNAPIRAFHTSDVVKNIAFRGRIPEQSQYGSYKMPPPCDNLPLRDDSSTPDSTVKIEDSMPEITPDEGVWIRLKDFGTSCVIDNKNVINLNFTNATGLISNGDIVVGDSSGAVGEVLGDVNSTIGVLYVNNVSGTFIAGEDLFSDGVQIAEIDGTPFTEYERRYAFFEYSDTNDSNINIHRLVEDCSVDPVSSAPVSTEGYRDSIIGFEIHNLTSGASGTISAISDVKGLQTGECSDPTLAVFLEIDNISGGSRTTFEGSDNIIISFPGRPPFDQVVVYGGSTSQSGRANGYPDDKNNAMTIPPDSVSIGGTANIGDNDSFRDARVTFIANLTESSCLDCRFVLAPVARNGASFAPVPSITGGLVITDYTRDDIGGISLFPNFILFNRSNAFRLKFTFEQDLTAEGNPFTFLGRWSQLNPRKSNTGEPIEGITAWQGTKIFHYGGIKPAPKGHSDFPYVESPSVVYFGGFTKSDFENQYFNALIIINAHDINLGWNSIIPVDEIVPDSRAGSGIMIVNPEIENPARDGVDHVIYHDINDLDQQIWIAGGNNKPLENVSYVQAQSLDDIWMGELQYAKRSFDLGTLRTPIPFVRGEVSFQANVAVKLNAGLNGFMVPNGIRTSDNTLNSNKDLKITAELGISGTVAVDDIITGETSGASARVLSLLPTVVTDVVTGPKSLGVPAGHPDGPLFQIGETIDVNGVPIGTVSSELSNIIPQKYQNDRYTELSINDPTNLKFSIYGPDDPVGKPDWITPVTFDIETDQFLPDRENVVANQGSYFPLNDPVLGERRWTILCRITVTIPAGPGTGNWDVYAGVYNNGINSYVEYFLPSQTEFAFNLAFIELSGGQYNNDPNDPSGKSWLDVGTGTLNIRIRNIVQQPFIQSFFPSITALNDVIFAEIISVKWTDFSSEVGIKPFKSSWAGFVSDSRNPENIAYIGGRTHSTILTESLFTWNKPSVFVQNEQGDLFQFADINGEQNEDWAQLKHEKITETGPEVKIGEYLNYPVTIGEKYSAWGVARVVCKNASMTGPGSEFRQHVSDIGFTVVPDDPEGENPGLGIIQSENIDNHNVEFTGRLDFKSGRYYIIPAQQESVEAEQEQKLYPLSSESNQQYGRSVDSHEDFAVVGAPEEGNAVGAAYIYTRSGTVWTQEQRITASDAASGDHFGWSVSIHEDAIIVGAPDKSSSEGAAYVFRRVGGSPPWIQEAKLLPSTAESGARFGYAVAVEDRNIVISAPFRDDFTTDAGAIYLFQKSSVWDQTTRFSAASGAGISTIDSELEIGYNFGFDIDLSSERIIAGVPNDDSGASSSGSAIIIEDTSTFSFTAFISDSTFTTFTSVTAVFQSGGSNVTLFSSNNDYVIIGSSIRFGNIVVVLDVDSSDDLLPTFEFSIGSGSWTSFVPPIETTNGFQNDGTIEWSIPTLSTWATDTVNAEAGKFWIRIRRTEATVTTLPIESVITPGNQLGWTSFDDIKIQTDTPLANDNFGWSVGIDGDDVVVGAPLNDDEDLNNGTAYVFVKDIGGGWEQQAQLTAEDAQSGDEFGTSVKIDSNFIIVGAPKDAGSSGSAYIFFRIGSSWLQQAKLIGSDAALTGQFGFDVSISGSGSTVISGSLSEDGGSTTSGSAYIFVRNGSTWSEQTEFLPYFVSVGAFYGNSSDIGGDYAVVGAPSESNSFATGGAVYVYIRINERWYQQARLESSDLAAGHLFGTSVSIDKTGTVIAVGAIGKNSSAGSAYVFRRSGSVWTEEEILDPTVITGTLVAGDNYGISIDVDTETIIIGAHLRNDTFSDSGAAYIWQYSGGVWTERKRLNASTPGSGDQFGISVSLYQLSSGSGSLALIGARFDDDLGVNAGLVYLYEEGTGPADWTGLVTESTFDAGDFSDAGAGDRFGTSVSIDKNNGQRFIVGASRNNDDGTFSGSAYIFKKFGATFTADTKLTADDAQANDNFGSKVAIDMNSQNAVVSARGFSGGSNEGAVYVFKLNEDIQEWSQRIKIVIDNSDSGDLFGESMGLYGDLVIAGSPGFDDDVTTGVLDSGTAYIFKIDNIISDIQDSDLFQIVDINYHTHEGDIKSGYDETNNTFTRTIGDRIGGEFSSRIQSWVYSDEASIDTSGFSRLRDDRAVETNFIFSNFTNVGKDTILSSIIPNDRLEANTDVRIPGWIIQETFDLANTNGDNADTNVLVSILQDNPFVRMFGKVTFTKFKVSTNDPDIKLVQYFYVIVNSFGVSTTVLTGGTTPDFTSSNIGELIAVENGEIDPNYDVIVDVNSYGLPYITNLTVLLSPNIDYVINLDKSININSMKVDLIYFDNRIGRMKLPVEVFAPETYVEWQDTSLKTLFSFDGRQTWKRYDPNSDFWIASDPQNVIEEGMTLEELKEIISFNYSGWNNSFRASERNIPPIYQGFIEGSTEKVILLAGFETLEPAHTPVFDGITMNFFSGSFWTPKNFYIAGSILPGLFSFVEVQMLSPTVTRVINRDSLNSGIKTFKATVNLKRNS